MRNEACPVKKTTKRKKSGTTCSSERKIKKKRFWRTEERKTGTRETKRRNFSPTTPRYTHTQCFLRDFPRDRD